METPIGEEDDSHLGDFLQDEKLKSPEDMATRQLLHDHVVKVICTLSDCERKVIIARFGIMYSKPRTLEEVGKMFGVTRERIRQIEAKSLRKLRNPSKSNKLKDFLEE